MTSGVTGPLDLFNVTNTLWHMFNPDTSDKLFDVKLVSANGKPVKGSSGIELTPHCAINELTDVELLLIGGFHYQSDQSLATHLKKLVPVHGHLQRLLAQGSYISSFCTGTFILAEAGLLANKRATTSWWLANQFSRRFRDVDLVMDQLVVDSGKIWTAGATTAYTSLCISLIEKFAGRAMAAQLSRVMLIDHNRLSQLPFMSVQKAIGHNDKAISDTQYWLQGHLAKPITIANMADHSAMSQRTFIRRFKLAVGMTPVSYLQQLRMETAKGLLENTSYSLEQIIDKVGYDDLSAFRRAFVKRVQLTPQAYRKSFAAKRQLGS